jgi:hypothetical protein
MTQGSILQDQSLAGSENRPQNLKSKFEHNPGLSARDHRSLNIKADENSEGTI